ncbi:MAG TPA: MFS transporter [Chloroflexota bacterium]|nr:MFS transporter [Chloroflexota bacterium]
MPADPVFFVLLAAVLLGALDQTVVAATLPAIVLDFGLPLNRLDDVAWAITAYLAGYALVLPIAGQVADRMHRRDIFACACLFVFGAGSAAVGLGQDLPTIVVGRFVQSLGAGALLPMAMGRVSAHGLLEHLVVRIGWVTAVAEGGALLGPVYGAGMMQLLGWRWVFLVNVPCAAILGWLALRVERNPERSHDRALDWQGAVLLGGALGAWTLAMSRELATLAAGLARPILLLLGLGLAGTVVLIERRAAAPLLPRGMLRRDVILITLVIHALGGAALMAPLLLVPVWGNTLLGEEPAQAALLLARLTLTIPLGALLGSRLGVRWPLFALAGAGMALTASALGLMSHWPADIDPQSMTPALLLAGLGFGLMIAPTNAVAIGAAGLGNAATTASLVQSARLVGMTLASAAIASFGLDQFSALVADLSVGDAEAYVQAVRGSAHQVFTGQLAWGSVAAWLGTITAMIGWARSRRPQ